MENDVLRNKIAPWQEKGRWYHGLVDIATHSFDASFTDELLMNEFTILSVGSTWHLAPKTNVTKQILDVKIRCHEVTSSSTASININTYYYADARRTYFIYPNVFTAGEIDIWAFLSDD